ncbi:hypothetical protein TeGR_g10625 [Tetraparma gracilis]|uniref:Transmembrane protein 222 n=1 Tax=Tetraparma gracilis TaxID=2962635 RepID=A0ABQ6N6G7_9STRA|nr:hypothetical protein TeGR_g10625 [Tetraparma gracilis]
MPVSPPSPTPVSDATLLRGERPLYPMSICWSPLPPLTWLCPVIGHMGIAYADGRVCDFAGPYFVNDSGHMAFGKPTRHLPLRAPAGEWDEAVGKANDAYRKRTHNICCDNCHSHVARALNEMGYGGRRDWNMVKLALWMFVRGRFGSVGDVVKTFLPFAVILFILLLVVF